MLFVYACVDNYLADGGLLGFVITQSIFKSKGAGDGFRQFRFSRAGSTTTLKPHVVHDLSDIQVFEGAVNRTAAFICSKEKQGFSYPVPYVVWRGMSKIDPSAMLAEVLESVSRVALTATPMDKHRSSSPWLTAPTEVLPALFRVVGKNAYQAYEGVNTGGLNGCYWITITRRQPNGNLLIQNLAETGKNKLGSVEAVIEPDLVHPLLRGRDLQRWIATPVGHIIVSQDPKAGKGIPEGEMKRTLPKTYAYLKRFEGDPTKPARGTLRGRALFKLYFKPTDPFYSMYNVSTNTFAPWKVVYKRLSNAFQAAVVPHDVVPHEKIILMPTASEEEAHYVCGVLNSSVSNLLLRSSAVRVQTIEYAPGDVAQIGLPDFDPKSRLHRTIAGLSAECHKRATRGDFEAIKELETKLDNTVIALWGLTASELELIKQALSDLGPIQAEELAEAVEGDVH